MKGEALIDLIFTFASCKPKQFGVYKHYAADELDELLAVYEHDLCEAAESADAEHLTRIAQALYIMKTDSFENIWWRIERRTRELASEGKLDGYAVTNILRSFSRGHHNKMIGQEKTFADLEPIALKELAAMEPRDSTHLMYAYGVRGAGNPQLHKAFESHLGQIADQLDYPGLFNAVYYLLFRGCTDEALWKAVVTQFNEQTELLPLIYYRPFKIAAHWLKHHYPAWSEPYDI